MPGTFWRRWEEEKNLAEQSNGGYLKEYCPSIWSYTCQTICSASRYQENIASGENKPREVKGQQQCVSPEANMEQRRITQGKKILPGHEFGIGNEERSGTPKVQGKGNEEIAVYLD